MTRRHRNPAVYAAAVLVVIALGGGTWWLLSGAQSVAGTPRLVVDRTEMDLGDLPFNAPAEAVFSLTNRGNGTLKIIGTPPVKAVKGC